MKKIAGALGLSSVLMMGLVSAGPVEGVRQLLDGFREVVYLLIQFIFDISYDMDSFEQFFTTKLILGLIIYLVVYTVIKKNGILGTKDEKKNPINIIVSLAISILAIRYLPAEYIDAILIPYGALGVGLTVFLPLVIFFLFLHQSGVGYLGRRIGWTVFGTAFLALWWSKNDLMESANWIYITGIIVIIICFIFDRRIHRYFGLTNYRKFMAMTRSKQNRHWRRELLQLEDDYRNGIITEEQYNKEKTILDQHIQQTSRTP